MANPLTNEDQLYDHIKKEKIIISRSIWQYLFDNVGDLLSKASLQMMSCYDEQKEVPVEDLKAISRDMQIVSKVINKLLHPEKIKTKDDKFVIIEHESKNIPIVLKELIRHHVGNDLQAIQFMLGAYIDDDKPLSLHDNERLSGRLRNIKIELEKIKENTETIEDRIKTQLNHPITYIKFLLENSQSVNERKLEEILKDLESIKDFLS